MTQRIYFLNIILILSFISLEVCHISGQTSWEITEPLDLKGKYNLTRWVDMDKSTIEFEVKVETTGFVGFGLSYTGDMTGADIVIGGALADGSTYFTDRHAVSRSEPIVDESQDWNLISAHEQDGVTTMRFNRTFHTCDDKDIPITEATLKMIWAYGDTDTIRYHGTDNRGIVSVNLLDPPQPSPDLSGLKQWHVLIEETMPAQHTSYWCSVHKAPPEIDRKLYMVGFDAQLLGDDAMTHTHHFILRKCILPQDNEDKAIEILEKHVGKPGTDCQLNLPELPIQYCSAYLFVWAKGGQRTMFPDNVGFPIGENPGKEYFMLEIHYDNPKELPNVQFTTGLKIYYSQQRDIDAGLIVAGHSVNFAHTIPPNSDNFLTLGHCSPVCTKAFFPESGIKVFNVLLHSHLSGRKLKVRHFRDGKELAWIASDDNYDFNYQQNRPLRQELTVLPGDQLIYECTTNTTWKNGEVTIGDLSTRDEMCEAFIMYYPRVNIDICLSIVDLDLTLKTMGIEGIVENPDYYNNPIITGPESMANLTYTDALQTVVNWTPELRRDFQEVVRFPDQYYSCGLTSGKEEDILFGIVSYPHVEHEYQPEDPCTEDSTESTTTKENERTTKEIERTTEENGRTTEESFSTTEESFSTTEEGDISWDWEINETLDTNRNYNLTRWVNMRKTIIEFEVRVRTTGFVGFGLSYTGDMIGADIVIGGALADGSTYFTDRHAVSRSEPIVDESQDWNLISAHEQDGVTTMRFNRTFHTCDDKDIPITEATLKMIWAYGDTDTIRYHGTDNRGIVSVNLLDPPQPSPDLSELKEWHVLIEETMPAQHTSYWCSVHKAPPEIDRKLHMVGFDAQLLGDDAMTHTHHFILRKCIIPEDNQDKAIEILEKHVGKPGTDCQLNLPELPIQYCSAYLFVWAKGGQRTMFPDNVGFPIGENPGKEYFMLEIHYDNPKELPNVQFTTGLKIYYGQQRDIDAGLVVAGHLVYYGHTIPPNSVNFLTLGHCSPECTKAFFPESGIKVFNVLLHSHLSGRKLKVRHFREGKELAWMASDDNYDFNYQQNRPLRQELIVLPGDQLIYECTTDTTWKNGEVTIGDLSTRDEMCEAFIMYYPRVNFDMCLSIVDLELTFKTLGIEGIVDNPDYYNNPIITAPESMANLTYIDALQTVVNWTSELRRDFQEVVRFPDQHYRCGLASGKVEDILFGIVSYPHVEHEYQPDDPCSEDGTSEMEHSTTEIGQSTREGSHSTESTTEGSHGTESTTEGGHGSESTTEGGHGTESTIKGSQGTESTTEGRHGTESTIKGSQGTESTTEGGHGTESTIDGSHSTTKENTSTTGAETTRENGENSSINPRSTTERNNASWKTFSIVNISFYVFALLIMK